MAGLLQIGDTFLCEEGLDCLTCGRDCLACGLDCLTQGTDCLIIWP